MSTAFADTYCFGTPKPNSHWAEPDPSSPPADTFSLVRKSSGKHREYQIFIDQELDNLDLKYLAVVTESADGARRTKEILTFPYPYSETKVTAYFEIDVTKARRISAVWAYMSEFRDDCVDYRFFSLEIEI